MPDIVTIQTTNDVVASDTTEHVVDVGYSLATGSSLPLTGGTLTGPLVLDGSPPLRIPAGAAAGDVLTSDGSGNASWVAPASPVLQASGDTTGVTDSASIQALLDLGATVQLRGGTFYAAGLKPVTGARLTGEGSEKTIIQNAGGADLWNMAPGSLVDHFELDHLQMNVTGGHIFVDADIIRCSFHHLKLIQNSSSKSIWHSASVTLFIENSFYENVEYVHGATRSVPAWDLTSTGVDLITENDWEKSTYFNADSDATQYYFSIVCAATTGSNRNNSFRKLTFEHACGGAISMESATGTDIDNCWSWDTAANSVLNPLFRIKKNASNSAVPATNGIRNSGRVGDGPNTGVPDIQLDASCTQTTIENCGADGTGVAFTVDCGSSTNLLILNPPANVVYQNLLGGHTRIGNGAFSGNGLTLSKSASGGLIATIQNTTASPSNASLRLQNVNPGERALGFIASGDTSDRAQDLSSGLRMLGPGNAALDTGTWYRSSAGVIKTDSGVIVGGAFTSQATNGSSQPSAPANTTSTTLIMMGLGSSWTITPASSGKVLVVATGLIAVATAVVNVTYGGRYGTGTAPTNGAAVTGTRFGAVGDPTVHPATTGVGVPFALTQVLSLTPGTAYWFDLAIDTANASDAASVSNVSISLVEIQ